MKHQPLVLGTFCQEQSCRGCTRGVYLQLGSMGMHVCECMCRGVQGRTVTRPCWGRMNALGMATGRTGFTKEVRHPGPGRRVGSFRTTCPSLGLSSLLKNLPESDGNHCPAQAMHKPCISPKWTEA